MNATLIASLLLGGAALATSLLSIINQIRDRGRNVAKQEGGLKIDEQTFARIRAEAEQIGSDQRIAIERWWKEQFDAVKDELVEEQKLSRRLKKWADEHQEWDRHAWTLALETDPLCPPPPQLEHD